MATRSDFADYCCELLSAVGSCRARRMFGGWGISVDGLTIALVANLGRGERLWLKADDMTRPRFEAAGCARFTYDMRSKGETVQRSMNYYSAPEDAMDAPHAMAPWARLALASALQARGIAGTRPRAGRPDRVAADARTDKPARSTKPAKAPRPVTKTVRPGRTQG